MTIENVFYLDTATESIKLDMLRQLHAMADAARVMEARVNNLTSLLEEAHPFAAAA